MSNFGPYTLCSRSITTALADVTTTEGTSSAGVAQTFIDRFANASAVTLVAAFTYGSGGTSGYVIIDTALGSGGAWIPVARFDFTTASVTKSFTLSGLTPRIATPTITAPSADTAIDGIIGDRWRARLTTVGTYAGSTVLDVRIHGR